MFCNLRSHVLVFSETRAIYSKIPDMLFPRCEARDNVGNPFDLQVPHSLGKTCTACLRV